MGRERPSPEHRSSPADPSSGDAADELVAGGRVARLETRGRRSGRWRSAVVGFIARPDGALLVAASDPDTDWALNLLAEPACRVTIGEGRADYRAAPLEGDEQVAAVTELILRYGTPSERLGGGPAFSLEPDGPSGGPDPTARS